jgi:hypothetical protein
MMKRHVLMNVVATVINGAVFVAALFRQYALVEVAASVLTGLQVFFMSSTIGDLLDKRKEPNRARTSAVVLFTIFLVAFYYFTRYLR